MFPIVCLENKQKQNILDISRGIPDTQAVSNVAAAPELRQVAHIRIFMCRSKPVQH